MGCVGLDAVFVPLTPMQVKPVLIPTWYRRFVTYIERKSVYVTEDDEGFDMTKKEVLSLLNHFLYEVNRDA